MFLLLPPVAPLATGRRYLDTASTPTDYATGSGQTYALDAFDALVGMGLKSNALDGEGIEWNSIQTRWSG